MDEVGGGYYDLLAKDIQVSDDGKEYTEGPTAVNNGRFLQRHRNRLDKSVIYKHGEGRI